MHAYLLIGNSPEYRVQSTKELAEKLKAKILEFPIAKIEDTRNLNDLIRLSFNEPTLIVCENIDEATEEALNAFLKNLEEPQDNIYFGLTAHSTRKVLPTIVSRCEVIKTINNPLRGNNENAEKFLSIKTGERLAQIDKIKDRGEATALIEDILNYLHRALHSDKVNYQAAAKNAGAATKTLASLRANGNIGLQLTNFVISLEGNLFTK